MHFGDGNITWVDTVKYFGIVTSNSFISGYHVALLPLPKTGYVIAFVGLFGTTGWRSTWKMGGKTECVTINTFT